MRDILLRAVDVGQIVANIGRELRVNTWFLAHVPHSARFETLGRLG